MWVIIITRKDRLNVGYHGHGWMDGRRVVWADYHHLPDLLCLRDKLVWLVWLFGYQGNDSPIFQERGFSVTLKCIIYLEGVWHEIGMELYDG
jgi:hypothetical protein